MHARIVPRHDDRRHIKAADPSVPCASLCHPRVVFPFVFPPFSYACIVRTSRVRTPRSDILEVKSEAARGLRDFTGTQYWFERKVLRHAIEKLPRTSLLSLREDNGGGSRRISTEFPRRDGSPKTEIFLSLARRVFQFRFSPLLSLSLSFSRSSGLRAPRLICPRVDEEITRLKLHRPRERRKGISGRDFPRALK